MSIPHLRTKTEHGWCLIWRSYNKIDGWDVYPFGWFKTRQSAREYVRKRFGYINKRPDLKSEPHGWRPVLVSKAVRTTEANPNG